MTRFDIFKARGLALLLCFALILDLIGNALISAVLLLWAVLTKQEGEPPCAFEPMSARAGRAFLNRKPWARVTVPVIDWIFSKQDPVAALPDGREFAHPSHCVRAFVKLKHAAYLPREYQGPLPPSLEDCYRITTTQGKTNA